MNQIQPKQDAYLLANGRYWQGIVTTDRLLVPNNPNDATDVVLEVLPDIDRKPTDQAESWRTSGINLGTTLPMAIEVHVYNGPQGHGYVGIVYARWDDTIYTRKHNSGPETWRTEPWRIDPDLTARIRELPAAELVPQPGRMARMWATVRDTVRSWFA